MMVGVLIGAGGVILFALAAYRAVLARDDAAFEREEAAYWAAQHPNL